MPRCSRTLFAALLLSGASLASCSKSDPPSPAASADQPRPVTVAQVEVRDLERLVTVTGSFLAHESATLSVKVPGRLRTIHVDLGSPLRAGEIIAQVDPVDYEIRVRQAEAAVAQARATLGLPLDGTDDVVDVEATSSVREARAVLEEAATQRERQRNLSKAGLVSASGLDTIEATYKVALNRCQSALEEARTKIATLGQRRAELALALKQLADTTIRAPFDGVIQRREAGLGEYVAAGAPIVTLVSADPLRLRLEIPEREASAVRPKQLIRLRVEGYTNRWTGSVDRLSPALNDATRTLVVESDISHEGVLRPGLFVRAEIVVNDRERGLTIPSGAVLAFAGLEKVIVVQESRAVERLITTGRVGAGWIEVASGLSAGESVVVKPGGLRTGQAVTVTSTAEISGPIKVSSSSLGSAPAGP